MRSLIPTSPINGMNFNLQIVLYGQVSFLCWLNHSVNFWNLFFSDKHRSYDYGFFHHLANVVVSVHLFENYNNRWVEAVKWSAVQDMCLTVKLIKILEDTCSFYVASNFSLIPKKPLSKDSRTYFASEFSLTLYGISRL